jgi:hypothetical protein
MLSGKAGSAVPGRKGARVPFRIRAVAIMLAVQRGIPEAQAGHPRGR